MSFEKIVGNEKLKEIFLKAVKTNNILHSYMFLGIDGIGKKIFAKEFAKMILCENKNEDGSACLKCKSCLEFENNNHPDFMIIEKEEDKKEISIDQIRYMQQKIAEKPITSDRKVYIIENSEQMNKSAQNCLLKTLEEPPEYATIILICSNENKLLNTIRSRCIKINFNKISDEEILNYINENEITNISNSMISFCDGSIGKLLKIKDEQDKYAEVEKIINALDNRDLVYILNNSEVLYTEKESIIDLLEYINVLLFKSKQINKIKCVEYVEEAKERILNYSNYDMTIDNLLMKMWECVFEK